MPHKTEYQRGSLKQLLVYRFQISRRQAIEKSSNFRKKFVFFKLVSANQIHQFYLGTQPITAVQCVYSVYPSNKADIQGLTHKASDLTV